MNKMALTRTVILVLALINQALAIGGKSPLPVENEAVELWISMAWTGIASILAWWKNNSISAEAKEADQYLKELKQLKK